MSDVPENVRQILVQLLPAAIIHEISCFAFYDNHPRDVKQIDVTICTKTGEVREYFQRDLLFSIQLDDMQRPAEVKIIRNNDCDLFYFVRAGDKIAILSRKETLKVHQTVNNVDRCDVIDLCCTGKASLMIVKKDDAVPLTFDDNLENITQPDISQTFTELNESEALPIITHLKRKLIEARYSVKCNEKSHKELLSLRQMAAFSMYKSIYPNLEDSVIKSGIKQMRGALKVVSQIPWVKVCNKKLVLVFTVCSQNTDSLGGVHILLHGTTRPTLTYITKLFEKTDQPPFWKEKDKQTLEPHTETAVVTVLDLKEIKHNATSKIELNAVILYTYGGKECLLPLDIVNISTLDTMGEDLDVLSCEKMDSHAILAILATSEKTDLILRHIKNDEDKDSLEIDLFSRYLKMEQVLNAGNIVVHKKSPYHVLNGVMIIARDGEGSTSHRLEVSVYSGSSSQVLALIHYIHDAVPLTLMATPPNYKIASKTNLTAYDEDIPLYTAPKYEYDYLRYASSILDRTSMILDYLNNSMIKMNESKNPVVQSKVGTEIDLLAEGAEAYQAFKRNMLGKALEGID